MADETPDATATEASARSTLTSSIVAGASSFAIVAVLALVSSVLTARLYGVHVVGQFALISILTSSVWILSTIQEQPALIRQLVPLKPKDPRIAGHSIPVLCFSSALTMAVGGIAVAVGSFLYPGPLDAPELFEPAVILIAGYVLVMNPGWNLDTIFIAMRAARSLFWIRINQGLSFLVLAVAARAFTGTYWGLVAALGGSWVISVAHRCALLPRYVTLKMPEGVLREGFQGLPNVLRFGIRAAPGALADGVTDESGTWMIGIFGSVAGVGAFSRAWTSSRQFFQLIRRVSEMLLPALVERGDGNREGFERALVDSMRLFALAAAGIASVVGGAATGLMSIYGTGFVYAANALALLILVPFFFGLATLEYQALFAAGQPLATSAASAIRLAVTITAGVPLTLTYGVTGTAGAMAAGSTAQMVHATFITRRSCNLRFLSRWPMMQIAALAMAYVSGFATGRLSYFLTGGVVGIIVSVAAAALVYGAVLVLAGGVHHADRVRATLLVKRARSRL